MIFTITGSLLVAAVLFGIFGAMAVESGWRVALTIWGLAAATTAVVTVGILLAVYGVQGHL
jgi:hypothetical protein